MTRLLAGELIKVRTTRTALGFALAGVLLTLATVLISTLAGDPATAEDKRGALHFGGALAFVLLFYGVVGATGEYRHRTLAPAVLIAPDRLRLVLARVAAYALTAGLVGAAMGAVAYTIGVPLLAGTSGPSLDLGDYVSVAVGGILTATLCAAIGVGIGTLVRNQVAAVIGLVVWIFIIEPLLGVIDENWLDYTITFAAGALGQGGDSDMSMLKGGLVLAGWAAVSTATGALVDRRRDVE